MQPLIIVGTGLAGYTVAREWRKLDKESPLVMVTSDAGQFYSKPMLSNALASGKTPETLANATVAQMADQLQAKIRTRTRLRGIVPSARRVDLDGGHLTYARLVLAVGADPIRLTLAGDAGDSVLSVNDLDDYGRFRLAIEGRRRIVIMGAGLIGSEFANDLAASGYSVDVVDPAPWPLGRLLPPDAGRAMQDALANHGVHWHLEQVVDRVDNTAESYRLTLSDGSVLEADVILSAIGLEPRTSLAEAAGLRTSRGIVVNRTLAASAPDVYALGDCAEVQGLVLPYVMPIMHASRALAKTLTGAPAPVTYPAMPVVVKTPAWPTVVSPPPAGSEGEWDVRKDSGGVRALFRDQSGSLRGFALSGTAVAEKNTLVRDLPPVLA